MTALPIIDAKPEQLALRCSENDKGKLPTPWEGAEMYIGSLLRGNQKRYCLKEPSQAPPARYQASGRSPETFSASAAKNNGRNISRNVVDNEE